MKMMESGHHGVGDGEHDLFDSLSGSGQCVMNQIIFQNGRRSKGKKGGHHRASRGKQRVLSATKTTKKQTARIIFNRCDPMTVNVESAERVFGDDDKWLCSESEETEIDEEADALFGDDRGAGAHRNGGGAGAGAGTGNVDEEGSTESVVESE